MRTRDEIEKEMHSGSAYGNDRRIIEVLLDIRDILTNKEMV